MDRDTLVAIADRCAEAVGPDRDLDCEIAVAIDAVPYDFEPAFMKGDWRAIYHTEYWSAPRYTACLDDAMKLLSDDDFWRVENNPMVGPCALVGEDEGYAPTVALSLCAAALRARTQESTPC